MATNTTSGSTPHALGGELPIGPDKPVAMPPAVSNAPAPAGGGNLFYDESGNPQVRTVTPEMHAAIQRILRAKPDQAAAFAGPQFNGDELAYANSTLGWFNENSDQVGERLDTDFAPEMALLQASGVQMQGGSAPLEQDLLNRVLSDYVYPSLAQDKANGAAAGQIVTDANKGLDTALAANQKFINSGFTAAGYLSQFNDRPDTRNAVQAKLEDLVKQGIASNIDDAAQYYYDHGGKAAGDKDGVVGQLSAEYGNAADVQARLAASAQAQAATRLQALDAQKAQMSAALEANLQTRMQAIDASTGQLKAGSTALDAQKLADLDEATAQLRSGLQQLETERTASLGVLNDTRLAAAQGQVSAVNVGLERTKDDLTAQNVARGFTGGSSADDAALARAVIGARQDAAGVVGSTKVTNATDSRNLADAISGQRFGITSGDATQRQGIKDAGADRTYSIVSNDAGLRLGTTTDVANQRLGMENNDAASRTGVAYDLSAGVRAADDKGTAMRSTYFDQNSGRQLAAALVPAQIATSKLSLMSQAGDIGQQGLTRSLNNLNWFASGATPTQAGMAPTVNPSQVGNDIAGLGAGLFTTAANTAAANNWWQGSNAAANAASVKSQVIPGTSASAGQNTMTPYTVKG